MGKDDSLSIEVLHLYGIWDRELREANDAVTSAAAGVQPDLRVQQLALQNALLSRQWLAPYLQQYESRVHVCLLLDDYFRDGEDDASPTPREVADTLVRAYEDVGIPIHTVVSEAGLSRSVDQLVGTLAPRRAASNPRSFAEGFWVGNGETRPPSEADTKSTSVRPLLGGFAPPRDHAQDDHSAGPVNPASDYFPTRRQHSVRIDVEVSSSNDGDRRKPYSCAVLAGWWQLLRLGVLPDRLLDEALGDAILFRAKSSPAFACKRSFSLLPFDLIDVEVAVRTIIENISAVPESWRNSRREPAELRKDLLNRISYLFVPRKIWD